MNTRNLIFSFVGGMAFGALIAYGYLKKTGKLQSVESSQLKEPIETENESHVKKAETVSTNQAKSDSSSFTPPTFLDTHKVRYDGIVTKPDLEELSKKYESASIDRDMAERKHPEDDIPEEYEEEDEETALENEIGEALMDHINQTNKFGEFETDGFGHVLFQIDSKRKENLVYMVHIEHAGEIYPLEDLVYYAGDDVLCDVMDVPVDDVDRIIGDAVQYFGQDGDGACGEGPDKLYVRNCAIGFEYEITRKEGYFGAHLYGATDEEVQDAIRSGKGKRRAHRREDDEE